MAGLHGGRRAGAGRKPVPRPGGVLLGMDGARAVRKSRTAELPPAVSEEAREGLLRAPSGLSERAKVHWEAWASQAIAERTLTPATAAGFSMLCEQWAYVEALAGRIALLGPGTQDALPYLSLYARLESRLDVLLARFRLTSFGKPVTSDKPKAAANPWGAIAKPATG